MDKLETTKSQNTANDAITDDVAAKAYIENFANDTFIKADESQRSSKVTRQTADTFKASATFLDSLSIWGEVEKDLSAKSKFAKFHAARILKAFKAGEDPNETNPVVEEPSAPAEDGIEAELKDLERQESGVGGEIYRPPTVESAPDSRIPSRPNSTLPGDVIAPPPLPTRMPNDLTSPAAPQPDEHDVSPIEPADNVASRQGSVGGGYFPNVPSAPAQSDVDMTGTGTGTDPTLTQPPQSPQQPLNPQDFYNTAAPPPTAPSLGSLDLTSPGIPQQLPPAQPPAAPLVHAPPIVQQIPRQVPAPAPAPATVAQAPPVGGYRIDDESTMAAQKHARWAISALNFEDASTAVKELRLALQSLGAA